MIPKEGGNQFAGSVTGLFSNDSLMSDNLSDDLIARGLKSVNSLNYIYDAGFTLGGPILKDRLWFYGSFREWGNKRQAANKFYNATQHTPFYTPDLSRPAFAKEWYESKAIRLTWRATEKNKFNFFADPQRDCHCPALTASGSVNAPEAFFSYNLKPAGLYQITWSSPLTNKLLLEAGAGRADGSWPIYRQPEVTRDDVSIVEQSTGMRYNSGTPTFGPLYYTTQLVPRFSQRFSASYVSGGHNIKGGLQFEESYLEIEAENGTNNVEYAFNNQVPVSVTQWATPYGLKAQNRDFAFYIQDQWTLQRLTLTYGLRYEYFNGYVPAQHVDATPNGWVPERNFAEVKNVPMWKDIDPRIGAAYDLFGNGRTAMKVALGRYVAKTAITLTQNNNPIQTSINSVSRTWNDSVLSGGRPASRQLRSRLRPRRSRRQRRVRRDGQSELRRHHHDDSLRGRCPARIRRTRLQLGLHDGDPARTAAGRLVERGLLPQLVRQSPGHGQRACDACRLQPVLHHGAVRFATARWRWL